MPGRDREGIRAIESRLGALNHVETDEDLWRTACEYAFRLRRKGLTIPSTDVLIAACALQEEAVLIHGDAHFDLMAKPLGLRVESHLRLVRRAAS